MIDYQETIVGLERDIAGFEKEGGEYYFFEGGSVMENYQNAITLLKHYREMLIVAKCPACDGSGAIPHGPTPDGDWEWEQCQWCDERKTLEGPK